MWLCSSSLVVLACVLTASPSRACSLTEPPQPFTAVDNPNDATPPVLKSAQLDVKRAKDPGSSDDADCGNIGSYVLHVDSTDDVTRPEKLAYSFKLVKGTLPFELPDEPVRAQPVGSPGELSSWFTDKGGAFDAVVAVSTVDEAGNVSEPVEVHASGGSVNSGCGVAIRHPSGAAVIFALGALFFVRRSRRAPLEPAP